MDILRHFLFVLAVFGFTFTIAADAKPLFLCDDGKTVVLTDRAELGCPVYKAKGELITVPDGATWADVEWAAATQHPEAFQPQPERRVTSTVAKGLCHNPWPDLKLRPHGDVDAHTKSDLAKWRRWSRIGSLIRDPCERYMAQGVSPRTK